MPFERWTDDERRDDFDRWYWPRAVAVILVVLVVVSAACSPTRRPKMEGLDATSPSREEALPDASLSDGRRFVPLKPQPWQKRPVGRPPKCQKGQHVINGACWYKANPEDFKPPCDAPTFESGGDCYHAVAAPEKPPTSIER